MHEVILFYNGLEVPTRQILDSKAAMPFKTDADAKVAIQEMAGYLMTSNNCMTRSSTKELLSPFENPKQKFRSKKRLFDTPSLIESNSPEFNHTFDIKEQSHEGESGSKHEDANEHIEKALEIVDLFHIPKVTQDQIMIRAFPVSLTGAASRWLRNQPSGSITTWEILKTKFLNKCCPPARTAKKMEEINNFQQERDEILFRAWERFKKLLMKSTETSDGLAAIQAQLNNLGREIKKVNEKVYADQVGCELCKGLHYTKYCPQKEKGKTLEEAYYTQFGAPYQPGGQYRAAGPRFYQRNNGNTSYPDRRPSLEEALTIHGRIS
ncbi:uncharacterized mitochondrial protein-like protein [Tanacetum coccineum]